MRRNSRVILVGGVLVGFQAGIAFGLSSVAPFVGVFQPLDSVLGLPTGPLLEVLGLLGGVPGGFLAGFASHNERGHPDAVRGLLSGVVAGVVGLVLAYAGYLVGIAGLTALGTPLPLSPLYLATVIPLKLGLSVLFPVSFGALLAGGAGGLLADPATDVLELLAPPPEDASPAASSEEADSAEIPEHAERITERAVYAPATADFDRLVDLLDHSDQAVRDAAVRALASVSPSYLDNVTAAVPGLVDALDHEDRSVRHRAAKAIARIAEVDPEAVAPETDRLAERLPDADVRVRNRLTDALGSVAAASPDRADVVLGLLEDEDPAVRGAAVSVLGNAPSAATSVIDRLIELFERAPYNRDGIAAILAATAREAPASVAPAAPMLIQYLEDDPAAREAALEALARIAVHEPSAARPAVGTLADALGRVEAPLRGTIADGVVAILRAFPEDTAAVDDALSSIDRWRRSDAERAIEEAADDAGVEELLAGG